MKMNKGFKNTLNSHSQYLKTTKNAEKLNKSQTKPNFNQTMTSPLNKSTNKNSTLQNKNK
jgi:hypothetical protein